jgi:alpha-N-arabinofuranosidase
MKIQIAGLAVAALCLAAAAQGSAQQTATAPDKIVATIDASQTGVPVSPYEYGMFIEHIGNTMYSSLWAEMLDDRKFYFPIVSKDPESQGRPQGNPIRMQLRKWRPVGPDEVIVMDKDNPFVGDQSPRIELDAAAPHGIRQAGLALVSGKRYTGRIYLRGTPGARVKVALVRGSGPNDRQTISLPALASEYKKYPIAFTAGSNTTDAALEITGTGTGNFHIGTLSLMPADNIEGFRSDTRSSRASGVTAAITPLTSSGTTPSAIAISARRTGTTPGTPCRPMIWAWMNS